MQGFLTAVHIDAVAERWTLTPFRSPFYSDEPKAEPWAFRNTMGWRVHIDFRTPYWLPRLAFQALPEKSFEQDPTGNNTLDNEPWSYRQRRGLVIAGFAKMDEAAIASRLRAADLPVPNESLEVTPRLTRRASISVSCIFPTRKRKSRIWSSSAKRPARWFVGGTSLFIRMTEMDGPKFNLWHAVLDRDLGDLVSAVGVDALVARWTVTPFAVRFMVTIPKREHWTFRKPWVGECMSTFARLAYCRILRFARSRDIRAKRTQPVSIRPTPSPGGISGAAPSSSPRSPTPTRPRSHRA